MNEQPPRRDMFLLYLLLGVLVFVLLNMLALIGIASS